MTESQEIEKEAEHLYKNLQRVGWSKEKCRSIAPITLEINRLKKELNAIILAHSYQTPDIIFGVADFVGDSFGLSKKAQQVDADIIVFAGVKFMAETAKILNPEKTVILPSLEAGCSLADSITGEDVRKLKAQYPNVPVVSYINTNVDVKAESDVICTSSNAAKIIKRLESDTVIFIPDMLMLKNLSAETGKKLIGWNGKCVVHEEFNIQHIQELKKLYPDIKILAHLECDPSVAMNADFVGSTSQMIEYVKKSPAKKFMLATECGLVERLKVEISPEKEFYGACLLCPYMKKITLENILESLLDPDDEQIIKVDKDIQVRALSALQKMFELSK